MKKFRAFLQKVEERKGFALTEMILAVLVLSGMLIVAWNLYARIRDSNLTSTAKQYLLSAVSQTQSIFKSEQYDFDGAGLNEQKMVQLGIWPKDYLRNNKLVNGWGGNITMKSDSTGNNFTIEFTNVPQTPCVELSSFGSEWVSVTINKNKYTQDNGQIPVKAQDAISSCVGDGTATNNNTITWESH